MIALLRLLMPDINIAAATALEILDPRGREMGVLSGANVIMPNITPREQMVKYNLYNRKTLNASDVQDLIDHGIPIGYGRWGDSKHYK
jgi:biotin synthase